MKVEYPGDEEDRKEELLRKEEAERKSFSQNYDSARYLTLAIWLSGCSLFYVLYGKKGALLFQFNSFPLLFILSIK